MSLILVSALLGLGVSSAICANARSGWFYWGDFFLVGLGASVAFAVIMKTLCT